MWYKAFLGALLALSLGTSAEAQNTTCSNRPAGDSSNACANTRFVSTNAQSNLGWIVVGSAAYPTIQSAFAAANAALSSYVWIPCGNYTIGTPASAATGLDLRNSKNIHVAGPDGKNGGASQCAMINYVGTGIAIQHGGSIGLEWEHTFINAVFASKIFDGTTGAAASTEYTNIHDNTLIGLTGTTIIIDNASSQQAQIERNVLAGGTIGIRGISGGGGIAAGQYMVNARIAGNIFQPSLTISGIQGLETATVQGNAFQGQITGYTSGPAGTCHEVNWLGNWHGDAVTPQAIIQTNCARWNSSGNLYSAAGAAAITQANTTGTVSSTSDNFIGSSPWIDIGTGNFLALGGNSIAGATSVTGTPTYSTIPVQAYLGSVSFGTHTASSLPVNIRSQGSGISPRALQIEASDFGTNGGILRINKDPGVSGAARIFSGGTATVDGITFDSGLVTLGLAGTSLGRLDLLGSTSGNVSIRPQAVAGTYNFNLPTAAGTSGQPLLSGGGGGTAMTFGTLGAPAGGTGQSTYAVGDILYASATNALSRLADVATGNALISGGVGVAPSWGKINVTTHIVGTLPITNGGTGTTTGAFVRMNIQTFCPSGCTTTVAGGGTGTYTPTTGLIQAVSECVGGGGGGGGVTGAASQIYGGAGGGSGSYCKQLSTAATIGASQTVSIGAGGAGGAGSNNGSAGGASSVGSLCTTNGGSGGQFSATGVQLGIGGAGGTVGTGAEVHPGNGGAGGSFNATASNIQIPSGIGGASRFGGSPISAAVGANQNGVAGQRGAGGSGAYTTTATGPTGGAGGAGYCIVTEYLNQ